MLLQNNKVKTLKWEELESKLLEKTVGEDELKALFKREYK